MQFHLLTTNVTICGRKVIVCKLFLVPSNSLFRLGLLSSHLWRTSIGSRPSCLPYDANLASAGDFRLTACDAVLLALGLQATWVWTAHRWSVRTAPVQVCYAGRVF